MTVVAGKTISHYKILSELGRGGMGVVYKAEDLKLKRTVALKFLRSDVLEDEEHKERFLREAQAAAALDHPNICTVHEIDEVDGETFIAMAFIEGQSVKDKIAERPLKLDEALDIAIQTAEGLKAAHQKGIVHRDIKPANLMLTEEGQPKVMDFGLAQLAEGSKLTKTHTMLGTPAYMSPEQARRTPTDRRTDIWSLGVVIYEMVTGRLPFEGERQEAVVYAIGNEEPEPITALRVGVPTELDFIVSKAMAKDAAERYQHVEEMIVDLRGLRKNLESGKSTTQPTTSGTAPSDVRASPDVGTRHAMPAFEGARIPTQRSQHQLQVALIVLSLMLVASVGVIVWQGRSSPDSARQGPLSKFVFAPGSNVLEPVISPDGRHIAYVAGEAERKLWVQDLDWLEPREIDGTEGAQLPFWSPGSDSIAFRAGTELKRVSSAGGPSVTLCRVAENFFFGGTWSPDGNSIVFSAAIYLGAARLYEVPARGGTPTLLVEPQARGPGAFPPRSSNISGLVTPHFLPLEDGGRMLLFATGQQTVLRNMETGRQEVLADGYLPVYSPSGHILYQTSGTPSIWALPFSIERLRPTGEAFPIAQNAASASVGVNGTLLYEEIAGGASWQLVWRDRSGKVLETIGQPQERIYIPALSPDERRVAVRGLESGNLDIWIHDVARPIKTRLTFHEERDSRPIWAPSGDHLAFSSARKDRVSDDLYTYDIFLKPADGSGDATELVAAPLSEFATDWSADGRYILYSLQDPKQGRDIWYLQRKDEGNGWEAVPFLQTPFAEQAAKFSPAGRFVAYTSDESGRQEVYVRPFSEGGGKWQVSTNGGRQPRWSKDGREMFYSQGDTLMVVAVATTPSFSAGSPRELFQSMGLRLEATNLPNYDVSADGERFVFTEPVGGDAPSTARVILNWYEEFRDRD